VSVAKRSPITVAGPEYEKGSIPSVGLGILSEKPPACPVKPRADSFAEAPARGFALLFRMPPTRKPVACFTYCSQAVPCRIDLWKKCVADDCLVWDEPWRLTPIPAGCWDDDVVMADSVNIREIIPPPAHSLLATMARCAWGRSCPFWGMPALISCARPGRRLG